MRKDLLAGGARKATFQPMTSVSQSTWDRIFGKDVIADQVPKPPEKSKRKRRRK
jgi:hypothetical protein